MQHDQAMLSKIWAVEMDILDVVHEVCKKHNLRYSLAFGSLIGAVRHGGFIPWDDDIDIIMPREDYNKLIAVWESSAPKDYIIQYKDKDEDFTQNFIKIRKNNTAFIQAEEEKEKKYHKGIFVDILPCDRAACGKVSGKLQLIACAVALLYSREHLSGTGGMIGFVERTLLRVPKRFRPAIRRRAEKAMQRWNGNHNLKYICADTIRDCHNQHVPDLFDHIRLAQFQGREYCIIDNPDSYLSTIYGNYMQLPPEEQRVWRHHPIIIDFEHNYEELSQRK